MLRKFLIAVLLLFFVLPGEAFAIFDMSIEGGYKTIDFGAMEIGEEKELSRKGGYEHRINFTSDNGRTWYFKAQFIRPFTSGVYSIPAENFQWIVEEIKNGKGIPSTNISTPGSFSTVPVAIYTSADTDNTGTEVQISLRYKLRIPRRQTTGAYTAHIRFIMVEEL